MTARVLNVVPSLTPQDGSIQEVHFTLQQLRILSAQGLNAGLMSGAYALPLNFLTKEELDEKHRKHYERLWKALMERSFSMGLEIIDFMDVIDKKIGEIHRQKDRLMAKDVTPEIIESIAQLDRDEKHFKAFRKEIKEVDTQRRNMSSEEDIENAERELKGFGYRFNDFIETLRMRNKRNKFGMEADGLDRTSAHSKTRKKGRGKKAAAAAAVLAAKAIKTAQDKVSNKTSGSSSSDGEDFNDDDEYVPDDTDAQDRPEPSTG